MAGSDQRRLRDKGRKVEEYPADVVATLRRNAREGPRSAVSGEPRYFGGTAIGAATVRTTASRVAVARIAHPRVAEPLIGMSGTQQRNRESTSPTPRPIRSQRDGGGSLLRSIFRNCARSSSKVAALMLYGGQQISATHPFGAIDQAAPIFRLSYIRLKRLSGDPSGRAGRRVIRLSLTRVSRDAGSREDTVFLKPDPQAATLLAPWLLAVLAIVAVVVLLAWSQ